MKIAQVVCVFPPYKAGIGKVARQFADISGGYGHEAVVFTPDYGEAGRENETFNFAVRRLKPFLQSGNGAFLPQLVFQLKDFDIAHLHYPFFGGAEPVWAAKALIKQRFKLIMHYHMDVAGLSRAGRFLSLPSKIIMPSLFRAAEAVTCASIDYVRESAIGDIFDKYSDKFYEIPFGVDTDKFRPGPGNTDKECRILFVGGLDRAHYFKGVNVLLKAASKLASKNWRLTVAGGGDLRDEYIASARRLGIADRVEFPGRPSDRDLVDLYRRSDFLVLPSINGNEAFGIVLLEAMACGLPVIASALPGVRTVFEDGKQGFLARPGDAVDLAAKMKILLGDNAKRREMGLAARELAETKYALKVFADKLLKVYHVK